MCSKPLSLEPSALAGRGSGPLTALAPGRTTTTRSTAITGSSSSNRSGRSAHPPPSVLAHPPRPHHSALVRGKPPFNSCPRLGAGRGGGGRRGRAGDGGGAGAAGPRLRVAGLLAVGRWNGGGGGGLTPPGMGRFCGVSASTRSSNPNIPNKCAVYIRAVNTFHRIHHPLGQTHGGQYLFLPLMRTKAAAAPMCLILPQSDRCMTKSGGSSHRPVVCSSPNV